MYKKLAIILSLSLLIFGTFGITSVAAEASPGYDVWTGKVVKVYTGDPSQLDQEAIKKEIERLVQEALAQVKIQMKMKKPAEPHGQLPKDEQKHAPVQPEQKYEQPKSESKPAPASDQSGLTADEQKMLNLVNQERQKHGLKPLKVNQQLVHVARVKAKDMIDNNYFSHHSPTYGSPADMLNHFGVSYRTVGENLAGNPSVEGAHQALMNSSGHRANILNGAYGQVGIGIVDGGPYGKMFVQLFTD